MEHMNCVLKYSIRDLGSNRSEYAIIRVSRAMGTIVPILDQYDNENIISTTSGAHKQLSIQKDQETLSTKLLKHKILHDTPHRKHDAFPSPRNVLHGRKQHELKEWMKKK